MPLRSMVMAGLPREHPVIGVLAARIAAAYESVAISGVAAAAESAGGRTVAIQTLDLSLGPLWDGSINPAFRLPLAWERVDGFIVFPRAVDAHCLRMLMDTGKPIVAFSEEVPGVRLPTVVPDNRGGVTAAVAHLVAHGHRRIAFAGCLLLRDIVERRDAYRAALRDHGIEPSDELFYEIEDNIETGGAAAAQAMLTAGLPSTAVITGNDFNALGLMGALQAAGCSLPGDQVVVGFDDVEQASSIRPSLSTVHYSFREGGRHSAELLLRMIRGEPVSPGLHLVPARFVARESCGCDATAVVTTHAPIGARMPLNPEQRLRSRLESLLIDPPTTQQAGALDRIVEALRRSATGSVEAARPELHRAAHALVALSPYSSTVPAFILCLREHLTESAEASGGAASALDVELRVSSLATELSRALAERGAIAGSADNSARLQERLVSLSLMRDQGPDPRALGWLRHTQARVGCLAEWVPAEEGADPGTRRLSIVSTYHHAGEEVREPGSAPMRVQEFPPRTMLEDPDWPPGSVAAVMAVKTGRMDSGLLALVVPLVPQHLTGHDWMLDTNALFSVTLERLLATERLRRSEAELATLSREMAHNLRNPLASIAMFAAAAQARAGPTAPPTLLGSLAHVAEVTRYATALVNDLLRYADLEYTVSGGQPVDLDLALRRSREALASLIATNAATVETGTLPVVQGRLSELQLVMQNLIENAVVHRAAAPPRVVFDATRSDTTWTVRCRDNGRGIPEEVQERAFEPFARGEEGTRSGLGLAVCRRVVESHGGRIWIETSGAEGTTIAFNLPAVGAAE